MRHYLLYPLYFPCLCAYYFFTFLVSHFTFLVSANSLIRFKVLPAM